MATVKGAPAVRWKDQVGFGGWKETVTASFFGQLVTFGQVKSPFLFFRLPHFLLFSFPLCPHSHSIWPVVLGALLSLPAGLSSRRDLPPGSLTLAVVAGPSRAVPRGLEPDQLTAWSSWVEARTAESPRR